MNQRKALISGPTARLLAALMLVVGVASACVGKRDAQGKAKVGADPAASTGDVVAVVPTPLVSVVAQRLSGKLSNVEEFSRAPRKQLAARQAPVALTSSDGQGLSLKRYVARAVVDGPLSHCELHLTFHNAERRQREGRFSLVLPSGATVARFAMKNGDTWMEGEVVEKQRARRVYEDFLHRKQDPALLEVDAGNTFSARVFPIAAESDKEIIVAWSSERTDPAASWTLPLVGLPELELLDVRVFVQSDGAALPPADDLGAGLGSHVDGRQEVVVRREHIQPAVDLEVRPGVLDAGWAALRAGKVAVIRLDAAALSAPERSGDSGNDDGGDSGDNDGADRSAAPFAATVALVDTSASGALAFEVRVRQLEALAARVAKDGGSLRVVAFDQTAEPLWHGDTASLASEAGRDAMAVALRRRGALGATDLGVALALARVQADAAGGAVRVVLFSDGIVTAGERDGSRLVDAVRGLDRHGVVRLDVVTSTAARDDELLGRLVAGNLPRDGVVVHAGVEASAIERLSRRTLGPLDISVDGAAWVWPDRVVGLQADGSVLVWAELKDDDGPLHLRVRGGGEASLQPIARGGDERLLDRAWARARIALLEREHDRGSERVRDALQRKAVALSLQHRVLSRWTSLLILESDADYARYGISRTDRAAILTVGDNGATSLAARDEAEDPGPQTGNKDLLEALGQPTDAPKHIEARRQEAQGDDSVREDSVREDSVREDSVREDSVREDSVREDSVREDSGEPSGERPADERVDVELDARIGRVGAGGSAGGSGVGIGRRMPSQPQTVPGAMLSHRVLSVQGIGAAAVDRLLLTRRSTFAMCARYAGRIQAIHGTMVVEFAIGSDGRIDLPNVRSISGIDPVFGRCLTQQLRRLRVPAQGRIGRATVRFDLRSSGRVLPRPPVGAIAPKRPPRPPSHAAERREIEREIRRKPALRGILADVLAASDALALATDHVASHPADLLGYVALGRVHAAAGDNAKAARAYGSLIDLFPARADIRRFAGNLLDAVDDVAARALALDSYGVAVADRADHPTGWLMRATDEARAGRLVDAIRTLDAGLSAPRRAGNFPAWERTAKELLAVFAGVLMPDDGKDPEQIGALLARHDVRPDRRAGMRLFLTWENDANDVDLHVFDRRDQHAYYKRKSAAGGTIFADVTTGWGPECFSTRDRSAKLKVFVHSYRQGPMGFAMGRVVALHNDGHGKLAFEDRPFVIMEDRAYADLGVFAARSM